MKPFHAFCLPIYLGLISSAHGQIFTSTGIGDTPELAKKDAITNAIKLGVGEMIVSKEELNNDQFTQKIVGYSDAYVKEVKIKSQVKLPSGVYESEVEVDIESQKLTKQLEQMNISVITNPIDNEEMLAVLSQVEQLDKNKKTVEDAVQMAKTLLVDYISEGKSLMNVEIVDKLKLRKDEVDPNSEYIPFNLTLRVTASEGYWKNAEKAFTTLKELSKLKDLGQEYHSTLQTSIKNLSETIWEYDKPELKITTEQLELLNTELRSKLKPHRLVIELIDKQSNVMEAKDRDRYAAGNVEINVDNQPVYLIKKKDGKEVENTSNWSLYSWLNQIYPYYENGVNLIKGSVTFRIKLYLTKEEMANLKDIKVYFAEQNTN